VGIHRAEIDVAGEGAVQGEDAPEEEAPRARARESLSTHLDRVIIRLTSLRAAKTPDAWDAVLEEFVRALDAMHPAARRARGEARERLLAELEALDARLLERARAVVGAEVLADAARDATAELEPFAARLSPAAYAAAHLRCGNRALRERLRLPILPLE
jgi:hypothetical protein